MINGDENEAKMKNRSHRHDINRPRPRHGQKYKCLRIIWLYVLSNT